MRSIAILLGAFFGLAGCGSSTTLVSGQVLVDGVPLENGVISLVSADGKGPPATATVKNGHYEVRTFPGRKIVMISAPIVVGTRKEYNGPNAPLVEITDESLPPRCNTQSELKFEVTSGKNIKDWSVESKKQKK